MTVTDDLAGVLDADLPDDVARRQLFDEAREAGAIVGVSEFVDLDWPDAAGLDRVALRDQIIDLIRGFRPDLVMTIDPALPDEAHQDHLITAAAVAEAVLLSSLPRVRPETGADAFGVARIAYYYTVDPTEFVDTSAVQTERHAALDCYRAQFTDADLVGLHAAMDRYERGNATDGHDSTAPPTPRSSASSPPPRSTSASPARAEPPFAGEFGWPVPSESSRKRWGEVMRVRSGDGQLGGST